MRLVRLTTNYPSYLDGFYREHPLLSSESYAVQHRELMSDLFGWADFWGRALAPHGFHCREIVANAEPLQRAWASEHGVSVGTSAPLDIVSEQLREFQPDVLFVDDYVTFTAQYITHVRSLCPGLRFVLGWVGAPCADTSPLRAYDLVLSNIPELAEILRSDGFPVRHMDHAFDPVVLTRLRPAAAPRYSIVFAGSLIQGNAFHGARTDLLSRVAERTDIRVFADIAQPSLRSRAVRSVRSVLHAAGLGAAPEAGYPPSLLRAAEPPVFGRAMYQTLADSSVSLNTHIGASPRSASNMRLFESTGVATCLLTERRDNLKLLFEPEKECVTYSSVEECIERAEWLVQHPAECESIARAGQARTLRDHTFANRAALLHEIIQEGLNR